MLGRRLSKPRRFSYEPRYYDPKKEEREGRRIKFKRQGSRRNAKTQSLFWLLFLLVLVLYFIVYLGRLGRH